jgi:hypothetical protein
MYTRAQLSRRLAPTSCGTVWIESHAAEWVSFFFFFFFFFFFSLSMLKCLCHPLKRLIDSRHARGNDPSAVDCEMESLVGRYPRPSKLGFSPGQRVLELCNRTAPGLAEFVFLNFFFKKTKESATRSIALLQKNIDLFWNHSHSKVITVPLFVSFGSAMAAVRDWL